MNVRRERFTANTVPESWIPGCWFQVLSFQRTFENSATTDEVNDLQAITFSQAGFSPLIAGNDAPVQFDGYAVSFHPQLIHKTSKSERRIVIASFAIDLEFHVPRTSEDARAYIFFAA